MGHAIPGLDQLNRSKKIGKYRVCPNNTWVLGLEAFLRARMAVGVNRSLNMFTLIAVGVGAAYFYSVIAVIAPGIFPFFPASRRSRFIETAGNYNFDFAGHRRAKARSRTGHAIKALLGLAAKSARIHDGQERKRVTNKEIESV
jgi:cation transport ATPase